MRAFMGIIRFGPQREVGRDRSVLCQIAKSDGRAFSVQESEHAVFLVTGAPSAPDPHAPPVPRGVAFAERSFLHNAEELCRQYGLYPRTGNAALLREIVEHHGDAGLAMLRGSFSLAYWNEHTRELTLARDCGRGESLYFHRAADFVVFASHLPDLLAHPDVPRALDEAIVAKFLERDFESRRTMFRGIERVSSRTAVTIRDGATTRRFYWSPEFRSTPLYSRDEDYIEKARELLDQAVRRVLIDSPRFAVMASGGLDSSAIVSTAARRSIDPIPCFTFIPEEDALRTSRPYHYQDERPYTELLAGMYPALKFQYFRRSDLQPYARPDDSHFERWPIPSFNISRNRIGNRIYGAVAAQGYNVVLGGGGGNFGLSWAGGDLLPTLIAQGRLLTLFREARATTRDEKSSVARVLAHELVMPSLPSFAKLAIAKFFRRETELVDFYSPLRPEIVREFELRRTSREDGFDPNPLWQRFTRQHRAAQLFDRLPWAQDINTSYQSRFGIEIRQPLIDRDLLEFTLNIPETLFRRNGVARWFMRSVLADRVPSAILQEMRRGAQRTDWFAELNSRRDQIAADVERMESSLVAERLFDIPRLKRLVSDWPKDAREAEKRVREYMLTLDQAVHVHRFIRWVTGGNA